MVAFDFSICMKALLYHTNKKVLVAESWNELTTKQYVKIVQLLHAGIENDVEALEKALYILSKKLLLNFFFIPADIRMRMHEHAAWIFDQKDITKQLLPSYKNFYGPADDFDNLRMKEFHAAEMAAYRLDQEKDVDALNELVAVLYRPGKKNYDTKRNVDGDIRIVYNANETELFKQKVKKWPLNIKRAIFMWYDGCRQQLEDLYPLAFESDGKTSAKNYYDGMYGIMRGIAEKKTYGNFDEVGELYVHLAFKEIHETKLEEAELKRLHPELYK